MRTTARRGIGSVAWGLALFLVPALLWVRNIAASHPSETMAPPVLTSPPSADLVYAIIPTEGRSENADIFARSSVDGTLAKITDHPGPDFAPDLSADRTRIVFVSDRAEPGNMDIYIMDADGRNVRRVTTDPAIDTRPSLAPDGTRVVFTRADEDTFELWIADIERGTEYRLTSNDVQDLHPAWSPDGRLIVFARYVGTDLELFAIAPDGTGEQRLTELPGSDADPSWSPDGHAIAFVHSTQENGQADLYTLPIDPGTLSIGEIQPVLEQRPRLSDPFWSTDGSWLAFTEFTDAGYTLTAQPLRSGATAAPDADVLSLITDELRGGYRLLGIDGTI